MLSNVPRLSQPSPNQAAQRRRLVEATKVLLVRGGPTACSGRAIAAESGLAHGLVHYYFGSVHEIVATAMSQIFDEVKTRVRATSERYSDPTQRLWAVVDEYLTLFAADSALLWFDYWVQELRADNPGLFSDIHLGSMRLLAETLAEVGVPEPEYRAQALYTFIIGLVNINQTNPQSPERIRHQLRLLSGELLALDGTTP